MAFALLKISIYYWYYLKFKIKDPKDCELYMNRIKSDENLMEVRSDTNVQIVRQICV